jgi:hypothetical protein
VEVRTEEVMEEFVRRVEKVAVDCTRRALVAKVLVRTEEVMEEFVRRVEKVAVD